MENPDAPKTLGDFEFVRELGRGGMGVVYEARQRSLKRRVALKVLSSGLGLTAKGVMRFRREAEAAARLHHTNIVPIYATGEDRGVYYYAMEFVDGPSLDQAIRQMRDAECNTLPQDSIDAAGDSSKSGLLPEWVTETLAYEKPTSEKTPTTDLAGSHATKSGSGISSGPRYFDTVAGMIADVADALEHAHNQGVIHRDIKPSNLLLSPDGRLSINDFGLARLLDQPGMTISGEFVGSPLYMSPEQITAGRAPLDHRTDIYSLGATLYELLTLQPPYPGRQRDQVVAQILHKEVVPPRRKNRRVPVDLETICLKAIDRDPDRRYQTAGAMAEDLRRFVNRYAVSAKRAGPVSRSIKWARRHPSRAACLILAVIVASVVAFTIDSGRRFSKRLRENQLTATREMAFEAAIAGNFARAEQFIKQAELLGAPNGWVRMLRGQIALHQGKYDEAFDHLKHAQDLLKESTAAFALLTQAYGESGDEDTCRKRIGELRGRKARVFEDYLFKGMTLAFAYPDEAIENLDTASKLNPASIVVGLLRSRAERNYAMDRADATYARRAMADAAAAKTVLPDNPIAVAELIQATIAAANIAKEHGLAKEANRMMAEVDINDIDERLLPHSEVRRARWQYFLWRGEDEKAAEEIQREPLGKKTQDAYLAILGTIDLYRQHRCDEALEVYQNATGPLKDLGRFIGAFVRMDRERPESLLNEYKENLSKQKPDAYFIFDWAALSLLGDRLGARKAGKEVRELMRGIPDAAGHDMLYAFVAGDIPPAQVRRELKKSRGFDVMAHFLMGIEALTAGHRSAAKNEFEASVATDYFNYYAYHLSRALLRRVEDRDWLDWMPQRD